MNKFVVTTSWDDGHKLDLKVSKMLKKYGLKGTFYIAPKNREFPQSMLLTDMEVKMLSGDFEIGAHTMTHPLLPNDLPTILYKVMTKFLKAYRGKAYAMVPNINDNVAKGEIIESKKYLEKLLGKKIVSFCYPAGRNNKRIQYLVKKAGFIYARTVGRHSVVGGTNHLASPTTLHAFKQYQDVFKIARFSNWNLSATIENLDWEILAKRMFDSMKTGGVYHFWGHSWIIDENNEWDKLERVLKYISGRENVSYVENKDLVKL